MAYRLDLPDGSFVTVQDDSKPRSVALEEARTKFPDAFPPPPGIGEQLLGAPKAFVKGIGSGLVTAGGGLAALPYAAARAAFPELAPFSETTVGRAVTGAEEYLAPSDEGFVTQVAGGLGSFASIFGPQAILRGIGTTGRLATGIAPGAATPVALAQTAGLGAGEARQRVEVARGEGIDVTPGEELAALSVGVPIGLTELLPVERLFKGLGVGLDEGFKFTVANLVKRGFQQGGIEGAQEVAAGLMQDLAAKGIYNPELEVGDSMLNEFAVGSTVGAIAQTGLDVLLRKDITAAYQNRLRRDSEERLRKETEALQAQETKEIAETKRNLGIQDEQILALPAPAPQVEDVEQVDPLMNPVGFFNANELTPEYLKAVNDIRTKEGKAKISQFSIEDLADAGAPQAEIDRLLAYKTGYDGTAKLSADDVFNVAQMKNVDVTTPGFADFLNRSTGQADVAKMSQPQLFAAFKALDSLAPSETLQILPQGTNATRFTDTQYNKAIKSLTDMFPQTNLLGRSSVLQEIKDYTGLESDRDAESLLQTAVRKGDLDTVSTPRYDVVDASGKTVRTYLTRDSAERAARKEGLSVRESTSINIALPGSATQLPGGPDIRRGTFKEGVAPAGFEIRSPDATLSVSRTQDEADAKAKRLEALRLKKAEGFLGQAAKVEQEIAKSNQKLESMEADGKAETIEYKQLAAKIAANNKNLQQQADRLKAKANTFSQPLEIAPKGEKPVTREGFTLFQDGKPVATFPDQKRAEEAALATLSDEQIDGIISQAPGLKGLMPKRLRKMAIDEKTRRQQSSEVDMTYGPRVRPIEVAFTGDRAAAEQRLRDAGLNIRFSPEIQSRIDELDKQLRPLMERLGLKDVRLKIVDAIKTPAGEANASYVSNLITVALNADNPVRALRHEGVHALKELGFFTPQQWKVLEKKAREEWVSKYNIQSRYQTLGLNQDEILEEAIADAFSDFDQTKAPAGLIGSLFRKVKNFIDSFGNAFRGLGFQTADDVFTRIEEGRLTGPAAGAARGERFSLQEPRIMGTGKIVGAPPGRNTEADRESLINEMVQLLEDPFTMFNESRFWYENSGQTIREMTRSDPELMERVVRLLSLYSQANSLGGNTTATIKSVAQLAQGQPTALAGRFPNETAKRIPAILSAPTMDSTLPGVDDKLMNFYRNLRDATFQDDTFADASTVDRWMMRLFGYPHAEDQEIGGATGVSNTQYIYAKDLLKRIADIESERTGEAILPRQIQAALWTYVRNKTEFDSLPPEKQATFEPKNVDFADYVTRATANITWESRPSTKINLIPGIHKANRQEQEAFNRAVRNIFVNPNTGEDKIFKLLDNQQLYSSEYSVGAYENLVTPNIITRLVLQKDDGEYLTSVADNYAAIVGYVTKQDAVPWYRADPTATGKDASVGYRVTPSVASTPEFENKLFEYLNEKMPGVGFTRIGGSFDFVNFRGADGKPFAMSDKKYIEKLQDALRMFASDVNFNVVPFRAKSGWIDNDWKENPDGQGYLDRLRKAGLGDLQRVIDGWSKDYDQIANDFGSEFGWTKFSLRSDESIGGPGIGSGISIRPQQPTAQSFDAVHYGKQRVNSLLGSMYGTGIKGAEARRVFSSPDPRVKKRAYFYIPFENGRMPKPEAGLGQEVHVQRLNNLLGPGPEMQALASAARIDGQFDENTFESAVIDAGYDGYAVPNMGMAVVLDANVPVIPRGTRQEVEAKPEKDKIQIGDRKYSLRQTNTEEFKDWFGDSTITNPDGSPKVMYHGTAQDISEFRPKQADAIFVTDKPRFAESFTDTSEDFMVDQFIERNRVPEDPSLLADIKEQAINDALEDGAINPEQANLIRQQSFRGAAKGQISDYFIQRIKNNLPSRANIMPLYVRAENPFDYENPQHIRRLAIAGIDDDVTLEEISDGNWGAIESPEVQEVIRDLFDGFYVKEGGVKNLAVYDPNQIKSAVGNFGTFSRSNDDIRYSLALEGLKPSSALIPDEGGNPSGNLGFMPEKLGGKPIRLLVGTHSDTVDELANEKMYRPVSYGGNHILNRIMSYPKREPIGAEELLEKIVRAAQKTSQTYTRIYKEGGRYILFDGKNSLILGENPDSMSIITMYTQTDPNRRYGNPAWFGRAPVVPEFAGLIRGTKVEAKEGRISPSEVESKAKRVYTPSDIAAIAAGEPTTEPTKGTLSLKKKMSLRQQIIDGADAIAQMPKDVKDNTEYGNMPGGYQSHNLYEARKLAPKPTNKLKKVTENNSETLNMETDYVLNVDGEHYYIGREEDPDDEDAFVYSFSPATNPNQYTTTVTFDVDELIKEIRDSASKAPRTQYSVRDSIPADIVDAIDRTTTAREEKGFAERIADSFSPTAFTKFRQGMINKYESIERLSRAAAESPQDLLADQSAIAAALFADRAAGVAAASFGANDRVGGIPVYKDGFTQISNENNTVKGLIPIFEPLAKYGDPYVFQAFQYYAGTRRGKRLLAEGREKVFTPDDIKRGKLLEQQYPEFKQAFDDYQKYNEGMVKFLKDTGVLSDKEAEIWMQNADYIPFYRQMEGEEGGLVGPKVFSPIAGVAKPKKLKGGEAPLADFMETVVRNSRAAIEAGMKNVAGQRVVRDMLKLNQAEPVPVTAVGSDIVTVKEKGLTKHYRVEDPLLVEALKGLNLPQLPFLEILAKPSEVLRNLVTKDPGFMMANLVRDSLQAWVTTGVSMTPIVDTYKNFGKALANMSPETKALANAGLFAGYDFSGDVKSSAEEVERALRERTGTRTSLEKAGRLTGLPQIWNALDKGSTASDVATRAEVYKKVLAETGNQAEAMYQAMEVLNFSRKGNSALIRIVTALVPFMNARIQGLDVLYRSGFGKMATATRERQQKAFMTRGLTLFALSSLYWALASETEEYKTATPETRDNNWIIGSVRIPIPFEIGTIFKVFPERIYEYFFGMDTGQDLKESIARNITSTLAFNPIPQAFLPAVENIANYSFFTGQPIVGRGMQDVAAPFQVSPSTSLLAQQVGEATGQSPMMIDNLIRGYTGTIGTYVVQALDAVMRGQDDPPKPAMTIEQFPVLKRFFASPQGSGTIDAYYNMKQRVDEATRTINFLERTGNVEDLQEYLSGKGGKLLMVKPYIQAMEKDMKSLREMRRAVQIAQIDADQKRQILDAIRASEVAITSRIQFVKKQID